MWRVEGPSRPSSVVPSRWTDGRTMDGRGSVFRGVFQFLGFVPMLCWGIVSGLSRCSAGG